MKKGHLFYIFFCLILMTGPLLAQGHIIAPDMSKRPIHHALELRNLHIQVTIKDQLATTKIEHRFYNPGNRWKEGTFYYALPQHARVSGFEMLINGRPTKAELLDAKKAKGIYEDIVRRMKDPALLQAIGSDLLKARVFPIEARAEKVITLEIQQLLTPEQGIFAYHLPLNPKHQPTSGHTNLTLEVDVQTNAPIRTLWSPSHALDLVRDNDHRSRGSFESKNTTSIRPFELYFSQGKAFMGLDAMTHTDAFGRYFLLNITPRIPTPKKLPSKDLILVLDTSGSMAGAKLQQAKAAVLHCLDQLQPKDRFSIIRFSTDAEVFADTFQAAHAKQKTSAKTFVADFEAMGGTHIEAALQKVLALPKDEKRPQVVIFLTDGKPTIGQRNNDALVTLIKNHHARVFPVGIGNAVNTHLLDRLAETSRGSRTYVTPEEDLEFKVSRLFHKIKAPVLTDLTLSVDGVRISKLTPTTLPDLFQGSPLMVMGTYAGHGNATIRLEGKLEGVHQSYSFEHRFPKTAPDHDFLPHLWAKRRVGFLLDQIRLHGESEEVKNEIVRLAKRFGLITPYTSYLILEDEETRVGENSQGSEEFIIAPEAPLVSRKSKASSKRAYEDLAIQSGDSSVEASQSLQTMANEMVIAPPKDAKPSTPHKLESTVAVRQGRAFYLVQGEWRDSHLKKHPPEQEVTLAFGSKAYFDFVKKHPELKNILSLGQKILFKYQDKTYRITSDD